MIHTHESTLLWDLGTSVWVSGLVVFWLVGLFDTGDTISSVTRVTGTGETTMSVLASSVGIAVVHFSFQAFVFIDTFLCTPVVPETTVLASTSTIITYSRIPAFVWTRFGSSANEAITNVRFVADTLFCSRISHDLASGPVMAFFAWISRDWDANSIAFALVPNITFGDLALVFDNADIVNSDVSGGADTVANLHSVAVFGNLGSFSSGTIDISAWIHKFVTDKTVSFVAGFAFAVVISLGKNGGIWNTIGIFVTVVLGTGIDRFTCETITIISLEAFALVVNFVSDDLGGASSVYVASTIVGLARIFWQTFTGLHVVTLEAIAFVTWVKVGTGRVETAKGRILAVVNFVTSVETITIVVFFADAIVANSSVDA